MEISDLELFKKDKNGGKWKLVPLTGADLPPVDMETGGSPRRTETGSPAPGRPCQSRPDKRQRESSGSPKGSLLKTARKEVETIDDSNADNDWSKVVEEAELVTEGSDVSPNGKGLTKKPDIGTIYSVSGTPSKAAAQPLTTAFLSSPVFSRLNKS